MRHLLQTVYAWHALRFSAIENRALVNKVFLMFTSVSNVLLFKVLSSSYLKLCNARKSLVKTDY